jgi:hypothetical protein
MICAAAALLPLAAAVCAGEAYPSVRDPITWDADAFTDFLDAQSIDPDVRIFLAQSELRRLGTLQTLKSKKPYRYKVRSGPGHVSLWKWPPAVRLSASATENGDLVRAVSQWRGLNPEFMTRMAVRESSLDNLAQASTSSGAGLFQFTESTWLCTLRLHGAQYGLDGLNAITMSKDGRCRVSNPYQRATLLALRYNGPLNSKLAADLTIDNFNALSVFLGRAPTEAEVYALHFFGETTGKRFIAAYIRQPYAPAAPLFPSAAASNPTVFYRKDGSPRPLLEIFADFARTVGPQAG